MAAVCDTLVGHGDAKMAAPFLLKRRAGWYFRMRVPAGLHAILGSHLTRSLKTRDYQQARRRAVQAAARLQACWQEAWHAMGVGSADTLLTAEDFIRADRQRVRATMAAMSQDMRARLAANITAAVQSEAGGPTPTTANDRDAELNEARLLARMEGMKEAMALLAVRMPSAATADAASVPPSAASALR